MTSGRSSRCHGGGGEVQGEVSELEAKPQDVPAPAASFCGAFGGAPSKAESLSV